MNNINLKLRPWPERLRKCISLHEEATGNLTADAVENCARLIIETELDDASAKLIDSLKKLLNTDDVYTEVALLMNQSSRDALNAKIVAKLHDMLGQDVDPLEEVSKLIKAREASHAD